ncbi:MAG: DUF6161 domain-containing protein [Oscillospiraceae bacterium]|nr:DUF6161 domain-containing protein [Oscillospiraceae bacterium]
MSTTIKFPKWMNDYFKENTVEIVQIPDKYRIVGEKGFQNLIVKSARQLYEHIEKEEVFWTSDVVQNNHMVTQYPNYIRIAKKRFELARESEDDATRQTTLQDAISNICSCEISSKTKLAKTFAKYSSESKQFFQGFDKAVSGTNITVYNQIPTQFLMGFIAGAEYKKVISDLHSNVVGEELAELRNAADNATEKVNEIMVRADRDYEDHNQKHDKLLEEKSDEYKSFENDFADFVESCREEINALENTYQERLKLSKPAKSWSDMEGSYKKGGRWWLAGTIVSAIIAITILTTIILNIDPFDLDEWTEGVRTTALITMIITVFMFIIRFTSKMATSSFHLARDAKEREQLSYFYLALIKENAVQESERHLIISSLFSRADTGLLKGDSSPEMPSASNAADKIFPKQP